MHFHGNISLEPFKLDSENLAYNLDKRTKEYLINVEHFFLFCFTKRCLFSDLRIFMENNLVNRIS